MTGSRTRRTSSHSGPPLCSSVAIPVLHQPPTRRSSPPGGMQMPLAPSDVKAALSTPTTSTGGGRCLLLLTWSDALARDAQSWADHLAAAHTFTHSGVSGENLAAFTTGKKTAAQLVDQWGAEEANFIAPCPVFKALTAGDPCSTTGDWQTSGTTPGGLRGTTQVGCGLATDPPPRRTSWWPGTPLRATWLGNRSSSERNAGQRSGIQPSRPGTGPGRVDSLPSGPRPRRQGALLSRGVPASPVHRTRRRRPAPGQQPPPGPVGVLASPEIVEDPMPLLG